MTRAGPVEEVARTLVHSSARDATCVRRGLRAPAHFAQDLSRLLVEHSALPLRRFPAPIDAFDLVLLAGGHCNLNRDSEKAST